MNFEQAKALIDDLNAIGPNALRRIRQGDTQMLSDRELIRGAREAVWQNDLPAALSALEELGLRKETDVRV